MTRLPNPRHEVFAKAIADGLPQGEAYRKSGYSPNASAASRLRNLPEVDARIRDIRREREDKIQDAIDAPSDAKWQTLAEAGITYQWVAVQYRTLYEHSLKKGDLTLARGFLENIQKIVEWEHTKQARTDPAAQSRAVDMGAMVTMMSGISDVLRASRDGDTRVVAADPDAILIEGDSDDG